MFDALPGVTCTKAPLPQSLGLLKPGLEKTCDVIVRYDMLAKSPPEYRQAFAALLQSGIGRWPCTITWRPP